MNESTQTVPLKVGRMCECRMCECTGMPKLKYPGSKFAIYWQQHKILQQLLSTNQRINPQNYAYISVKKDKFTVLQR